MNLHIADMKDFIEKAIDNKIDFQSNYYKTLLLFNNYWPKLNYQ